MRKGQIRKAISGFYYIFSEGQTFQTRGRGLFRKQKVNPLVGDRVLFESENILEGVLVEVLPRENEFTRPAIANVDLAVVVMSVIEPKFSPQLLDRYLTVLESLHTNALIYVTKTDLVEEDKINELKEYQNLYQSMGYDFIMSNPENPEKSWEELRKKFDQKLIVFMGQSGAGKSTLLNKLDPHLSLETGEISVALGRGKHTTRHVELFPLDGGLVADTPGFSSIDFDDIEKEELPHLFRDFAAISRNCRFAGCFHRHEPGCAVKEAIKNKEIPEFRYKHYLHFLEEIENRKPEYNKKNNR